MMNWLGAPVVIVLAAQAASPPGTDVDTAATRTVVDHWRQMWDRFDASSLRDDYAEDADFLNAFGTRLKGRAEILSFANRVVRRPNVQDRHTVWSEPVIRFVRPDVAICSRDYTTSGQRTLEGQPIGVRKTHAVWVLRRDEGKWHVISQFISDENSAS